ncbi:hypothetical protein VNO78_23694 [Psophocarpus tetragonolobus]|uniref:Uncharacterized protein n=1 Tax=Psophocarpus tetragonolobus TaxID=3891 RepID=A0AAN9S4L4_PSOTE
METGGGNKNIGEHDLNQRSELSEQGQGSLNNSHLEAHPSSSSPLSSPNPLKVPSDVTNNTEYGQHIDPNNSMITDEQGGEANQGSEIQNPPMQMMERPGESPGYIFPSHVFSKSNANSTVEWSTASNESLFSIYMGNTSFSNELICFKSFELDKPGDASMHDQSNASPSQQPPTPLNKFNDISQKTYEQQLLDGETSKATEAKAAETMREVIMESSRTADNIGQGDEKVSNSLCQDNANSHAFQSSEGRDKKVSSKGVGEKQNQPNQSEEIEKPNGADQAPKSTTNAPNKWLNCFSCCTFCK